MISQERKEFNKAVRELEELHYELYTKLEASIKTVLKAQPYNKITFIENCPQIIHDISNGNTTMATISAIWLEGDSLKAQMSFKDGHIFYDEPVSLWYMDFCDLYHDYTVLTEAIKKTLKEKDNKI